MHDVLKASRTTSTGNKTGVCFKEPMLCYYSRYFTTTPRVPPLHRPPARTGGGPVRAKTTKLTDVVPSLAERQITWPSGEPKDSGTSTTR